MNRLEKVNWLTERAKGRARPPGAPQSCAGKRLSARPAVAPYQRQFNCKILG